MEYLYESIIHQKDLPIKIFTHTLEQYPYHWHEDTELLLILSGACEMRIGHDHILLAEDDLFIINKNEIHFTRSIVPFEKTQILVLQFDLAYYNRFNSDLESYTFSFQNHMDKDSSVRIRHLLVKMMYSILEQESMFQLQVEIYMLELLMLLTTNFAASSDESEKSHTSDLRQLEILKYMNAHYMDADLSLNQIADAFFMNPQYLSRYFKNKVGIPLKKFLDNMRLNKSLTALQLTDERILDIALKYGFPDAKAYYRVFKEVIGTTPQEYRKKHKIDRESLEPMNYFSINSKDTLSKLNHYLELEITPPKTLVVASEHYQIQTEVVIKHFSNRASKLTTFGYAPHGLRHDFEAQLKTLQSEIGFEYVRFHGIFADEMRICNRLSDGKLNFNFNHIDALLDVLLKNNIKPFIELGFMPKALASVARTMFTWEANVSPPQNIDEWCALITHFMKHLINRYGIETVETWYFEFWNEPEIQGVFWIDTPERFFEFFHMTYSCIKSLSPRIKVGGFGNLFFTGNNGWLEKFNDYAKKHLLKLDFFSFHLYNIDLKNIELTNPIFDELTTRFEDLDIEKLILKSKLTLGNSSHLTHTIDHVLSLTGDLLFENPQKKEIWITEWNTSTHSQELIRDTCYTAPFIIKTLLENMDKLSGMGFWTFTDLFEELGMPQPLFHGGFGLMTYNGLRKPSFHAYAFMRQLGNQLLFQGERFIVTKSSDEIQILAYNYCHYNDLYKAMDFSQVSELNRYHPFTNQKVQSIELSLEGLSGNYSIERQWVNRETGSVFDAWVNMGAPSIINDDAYRYLDSASQPGYAYESCHTTHKLHVAIQLQPHEVQFIKIRKIY